MTRSDLADGRGHAITRRGLIGAAPAIGVGAIAPATPVSAAPPSGGRAANVLDFGARGDGASDDTEAFRKALAAAQIVEVPAGRFRITAPLKLSDGQVIRGAGRSGWEPYTGTGAPRSAVRTEIVIGTHLGFDARGTNNVAIRSLAIRVATTTQSRWGAPPGVQAGAYGIDIAGSAQFEATDISFHGLDIAVASVADRGETTQMPHIGNWAAHDCATVFSFVSRNPQFDAVRDARIEGCLAALHCNRVVEARHCDGLRIENCRFFQCPMNSILIEDTPFVNIVGTTLFETGEETLVLARCQYATLAGVQLARAGYYRGGPRVQRAAMVWRDCSDVSFDGLIEQPLGRALTIEGCSNLSIRASVGTPYWSTGNLASADGAIRIERSNAIAISASFSGSSYWIAVWADAESAPTISGRIATEGPAGVVRCTQLQSPPLAQVVRLAAPATVAPGATVQIDTLRILVPAGKALVARCVEVTAPGVVAATTGQRWQPDEAPEPGGGSISLERRELHRNAGSAADYASIPIGLANPSGRPVELPAGTELRLSLAME
jgi:hypothetical protein